MVVQWRLGILGAGCLMCYYKERTMLCRKHFCRESKRIQFDILLLLLKVNNTLLFCLMEKIIKYVAFSFLCVFVWIGLRCCWLYGFFFFFFLPLLFSFQGVPFQMINGLRSVSFLLTNQKQKITVEKCSWGVSRRNIWVPRAI